MNPALLLFGILGAAAPAGLRGDVNADATVDVVDLQCTILAALDLTPGDPATDPACLAAKTLADVDCDGGTGIVDVNLVAWMALAWPDPGVPWAHDPDGDNIHSACDVCPDIWDPDQADADGDGVGDACAPAVAGEDGAKCLADIDCKSGHCGAGICCGSGACCITPADCPASFSCGPVCTKPESCEGTRRAATCTANICGTLAAIDDSACTAPLLTCGPYAPPKCTGAGAQPPTSCPTSCATSADCTASNRCVDKACVPLATDGEACTTAADCASGHCAGGACCQSGTCCLKDADCPAIAPAPALCDNGLTCQGKVPAPKCVDGQCIAGSLPVVADDSGCRKVGRPCGPYQPALCTGKPNQTAAACPTSCAADADCLDTAHCTAGKCEPDGKLGAPCTAGNQCASGYCIDGVCCETNCSFGCAQCNAPGSLGLCTSVAENEDPMKHCAQEPSCSKGIFYAAKLCNGFGGCSYVAGTPCPNGLICADASSCRTACSLDAHCRSGWVCDPAAKVCTPNRCLDNSGKPLTCPKVFDSPCAKAACDPLKGCVVKLEKDATPCDDGDPCTSPDTCLKGVCLGPLGACQCRIDADCDGKEDSDLCNGTLRCDRSTFPYTCKVDPNTVIQCPPTYNPCRKSVCEPSTGKCTLQPAGEGQGCKVKCESDATCQGGTCKGTPHACTCSTPGGCAAFDDDDLCNEELYCDLQAGKCLPNPASVVHCSTFGDTDCHANRCVATTGKCATVPINVGGPCDDGDPCTAGDICSSAGTCVPGKNTCLCEKIADCARFEDGDACNGTLFCNLAIHKCVLNPATVVTCSTGSDTACMRSLCQPATGLCKLTPVGIGAPCDDANACTTGERCNDAGQCTGGSAACQCAKDADCLAFEDGNLCNGTLFCNKSAGVCEVFSPSIVKCPTVDDTDCMKSTCDFRTGKCALVPRLGACDDNNPCTAGDFCQEGTCRPGPIGVCQCAKDADCAPWDDGDLCNGSLYCDKSAKPQVCRLNPSTVVTCPTDGDTACSKSRCDPKTGKCAMAPVDGASCDDGVPCTAGDRCAGGLCRAGPDVCECRADTDCKTDCDPCTSKTYCDKSAVPWVCNALPIPGCP